VALNVGDSAPAPGKTYVDAGPGMPYGTVLALFIGAEPFLRGLGAIPGVGAPFFQVRPDSEARS